MENKKSFGESLEAFFAGKGFYIVLFLCVAVIGVSTWVMLTENGTDVEQGALDMTLSESEDYVETGRTHNNVITEPTTTPKPVSTPMPTPVPTPESKPESKPETKVDESPAQSVAAVQSSSVPSFFIWPVSGEVENGYSMTALQYDRTMRDWRTHDGLDIAAELGAQVKSTSDGIVDAVLEDERYGTTVVISHGGGLVSSYANLAATPTVKAGDSVTVGQVIGAVGDTALCESGEVTHLHFSMALDGESVDPTEYLP